MCAFEAKSEIKKQKSNSQNRNLQWSNQVSGMNWMMAVDYCQNLQEGGHSDWRLPKISELRTIIQSCSGAESDGSCRIGDNCLFEKCWSESCYCYGKSGSSNYSKLGGSKETVLWSSSIQTDDGEKAWHLYFDYNRHSKDAQNKDMFLDIVEIGPSKKSDNLSVRCVR